MLKGVNKQVIEVTDTGNQYIKKAILFIDPDKAAYDSDFLIHQAKKYLKQTEQGKQPVPFKKGRRKVGWIIFNTCAAAAAGAGLVLLFVR